MPRLTERPSKPQPTLTLTEDELPEINTLKVGGKYSIKVMAEMIRQSKGDVFMPESSRKMEGTFKIMKAMGMGKSEDMMDKTEPEKEIKMDVMKKKMHEYDKS